ncbi:MAG: hypothetical protein GF334_09640 [Candidatus Altiarchaeales archaeon]|nr:hypothetical protein [Candidatus Altiarchaeales archaeon]
MKSIRNLVLFTLLFYLTVLLAYSLAYTENHVIDLSVYIHAGDKTKTKINTQGVYEFNDSWGYDGQYFWFIAKNPFDFDEIKKVYAPHYRYQRILYPLTAYILSFGKTRLLPPLLLLINLTCVLASIKIYQMLSPAYASKLDLVYLPLSTGLFLSVLLDLTEPLWILLILAAFYEYEKQRHITSTALFTLALFAKETTLFLLIPLVFYQLYLGDKKLFLTYCLPLIPFIVWQLILQQIFGATPMFHLPGFTLPFMGIIESIERQGAQGLTSLLPFLVLVVTLPLALVIALTEFRKKKTQTSFILLVNAFAVFFFNKGLYSDVFSTSRNLLPLTVAVLLHLAWEKDSKAHLFLLPQLGLTLLMSLYYLVKAALIMF